jgi:excinuclease ABC subunit A
VLYVLDEPSIGLHQRDTARLLATLTALRDLGNTVVVVEHDRDVILGGGPRDRHGTGRRRARRRGHRDRDAGRADGEPGVADGPLPGWHRVDPGAGAPPARHGWSLGIRGARANNLQRIDVTIPLGAMTCVTGVSGSGKSTLVVDTIYRALARKLGLGRDEPGPHDELTGWQLVDKVVEISQAPIGRSPRSNPATYTGLFGPVRELFAQLPESRARGYGPGPLLLQREGWPLRGVRRRRRHRDRDALPAGRVRDVRGLPREALRPRDARGAVQRPLDRRRAST